MNKFFKEDEKIAKYFMTIAIVISSINYGNIFLIAIVNLIWVLGILAGVKAG